MQKVRNNIKRKVLALEKLTTGRSLGSVLATFMFVEYETEIKDTVLTQEQLLECVCR